MTDQTSGTGQQLYYTGIAIVVVIILAAAWLLFKNDPEPIQPDTPAPVSVIEPEIIPEPETEPEQVVSLPESEIPETVSSEPEPDTQITAEIQAEPLPQLDDSDNEVKNKLFQINWKPGLASLFITENMIRNFVVQVDNIVQGQLASGHDVVRPLSSSFNAIAQGDNLYLLDSTNFTRVDPYLQLLESVDASQLLPLYQRYKPLLEEAFAELGYPDTTFEQRLQQAISYLLQAPEIEGPVYLERPSVMYIFADPELEALPAVYKFMIRIGPENQHRVKKILASYQQRLK